MRDQYRSIFSGTIEEIAEWAKDVNRARLFDVEDYTDLQATSPRIYPVPASSTDLKGTEKQGDVAFDADYFYYVTEDSGVLEWRRIASASF